MLVFNYKQLTNIYCNSFVFSFVFILAWNFIYSTSLSVSEQETVLKALDYSISHKDADMLRGVLWITTIVYNFAITPNPYKRSAKWVFPLLSVSDTSFTQTVVKRLYEEADFNYHYLFESDGEVLFDVVVFYVHAISY